MMGDAHTWPVGVVDDVGGRGGVRGPDAGDAVHAVVAGGHPAEADRRKKKRW